MSQLADLARPFPDVLIHENPAGGGSYVKHATVVQRLLAAVGPFSFEIRDVIRGDVRAIPPNPDANSRRGKEGSPALTNAIVGAICSLSVTVDGHDVVIAEVGDCEAPHNWPHDGARLKDAASDALKRAAARIGCGLHLWAQDEYTLDRVLDRQAQPKDGPEPGEPPRDTVSPSPSAPAPEPAPVPRSAPADATPAPTSDPLLCVACGELQSVENPDCSEHAF